MIWAAGLFLLSTLFGCEAPQYTYVLQSPYFVTTDYDYENPVEDFDLEVLQEFIDEAYDPETQEIVLDNLGPELRAKIESIEAPLVMSNGFADTIIHTKPRKVLTLRDIEAIKAELLGQYADGWGKGWNRSRLTSPKRGKNCTSPCTAGRNGNWNFTGTIISDPPPETSSP